MTFKDARRSMLTTLATMGWATKPDLKVAHATSPDGQIRLWFKAQAVHFTVMSHNSIGHHDLGNARTLAYDLDIRTATLATVISLAKIRSGLYPNRSHGETGHLY